MSALGDNSIDLVVTSPPYPMIEMWDEIFFRQNKKIKAAFHAGAFMDSYELMHQEMDKVWAECFRVVRDGGLVCINIGDATRTLDGHFQLFPNHARIVQKMLDLGFSNLPNILWRKQTNAPNKFMGSGMLPAGAYMTLEHEYILIFRKGGKRVFKKEQDKKERQQSAYFWEERNVWFSDLWDFKGTKQQVKKSNSRDRSGAFPFELPYRLINMYSVKGDTVLDPFLGTGTTTLAAIAANRNSIGFEIDEEFGKEITERMDAPDILEKLNRVTEHRLKQHKDFVKKRKAEKGENCFKHHNAIYDFPVVTSQETELALEFVKSVELGNDKILADYQEEYRLHAFAADSLFAVQKS